MSQMHKPDYKVLDKLQNRIQVHYFVTIIEYRVNTQLSLTHFMHDMSFEL